MVLPIHLISLPLPTFADTLPPPLDASRLGSFSFDPLPCLMLLVAGGLYLWGVWRVNRLQPRHRWSAWRTVFFLTGLVTIFASIESFIGVYDGALFWDHMIQHLMLIMIAAPLLALGTPVLLLWRTTTGRSHELVTRALRSRVARLLDHPLVAFVLYTLVIPLSHLTSFYNLTLQHETVHNLEHLLFLLVGYLFWRQVVALEPSEHRLHPALRLAYLAFAVPVDTFTGLSLVQERNEIFPAYVAMHRTWGPSLVTDLHLGGTIMWVGGDSLMLLAMIPAAIAWVRSDDRHAARMDRELDALSLDAEMPAETGAGRPGPPQAGVDRDRPPSRLRAFLPRIEQQ